MKAKMITAIHDKYGKYVDMLYEYKGEEYFVRRYFSGNAMGEEIWRQHQEEQKRIDQHKGSHTEPKQYTGPSMNDVYALMGWDE